MTAHELPAGAKGLRLQTRLNGTVLQDANTDDMVFDIATLVHLLSVLSCFALVMSLLPARRAHWLARNSKLFMKPGDVCEVETEALGILINLIAQQQLHQHCVSSAKTCPLPRTAAARSLPAGF